MHDDQLDSPGKAKARVVPNPSLQINKQTVEKVINKLDVKTMYGQKIQEAASQIPNPQRKIVTRSTAPKKYVRKKSKPPGNIRVHMYTKHISFKF